MEYDSLWKDVIEDFFPDFLKFFVPELYSKVDFEDGFEFLDKELTKLSQDITKSKGKGHVDKLAKVYLKNGDEKWILIHVEVQGQKDPFFQERMFKYFYRLYDKHKKKIFALAIFADNNKYYGPNKFMYEFLNTRLSYQYCTYKILDSSEEELVNSDNPFASVILSALYLIKSKENYYDRLTFKKRLAKLLFAKDWSRDQVAKLFIFIEEILYLPEELESIFTSEVNTLTGKEEKEMGLSWEKTTYYKERYEKGEIEGEARGEVKGKVDGIMLILSKRFNSIPIDFREKLMKLNPKDLNKILEKALDAQSIDEITGKLYDS